MHSNGGKGRGYGVSATAVVAPVYISCEDFSFPQIITDLLVELLRWLCWRKGFGRHRKGTVWAERSILAAVSFGREYFVERTSIPGGLQSGVAFACSPLRRLLNLSTEFRSMASAALLNRDLAELALIG